MFYLTGYLRHAENMQNAAAAHGLTASMDLADFALTLSRGEHSAVWRARFFANLEGRLAYADRPGPLVRGFAGWWPYAGRQWETAGNKMAFKQHAVRHGIPTPAACIDPRQIGGPFIIKNARSSFGEGIRGPFLRHEPGVEAQ